jgi:two-component system, OmpR family, sensor histidine kinase CiaH
MFQSARLKLTAWYLIIIMLVSATFSVGVYHLSTREIQVLIKRQQFYQERIQRDFLNQGFPGKPVLLPKIEVLEEYKDRMKISLLFVNLMILVGSGIAGYFLAGRTLRPIQKMVEEQKRFITDASHELRTPLTALRSEMEATLLESKLSGTEARQVIQSNLEEVINLQYLSNNLLQLAQFNDSDKNLSFSKVNSNEVIEESIKKISAVAKDKKIEIENATERYVLYADKASLTQLFVILLDNAIKYSPEETKITISSKKTDHKVKISITDQGIGIKEQDIPHIFERFYRGDKSRTKSETPGYGLGLAIAKKIVESHKGTISIKSSENGTTFTISLPLKDQPASL